MLLMVACIVPVLLGLAAVGPASPPPSSTS
jgi:hypothetical protein